MSEYPKEGTLEWVDAQLARCDRVMSVGLDALEKVLETTAHRGEKESIVKTFADVSRSLQRRKLDAARAAKLRAEEDGEDDDSAAVADPRLEQVARERMARIASGEVAGGAPPLDED